MTTTAFSSEFLFVYGTLLAAFDHPQHQIVKNYAEFASFAYMPGHLYEVKGYPGAVYLPQEAAKIYGELYRIKQHSALFTYLDDYEECSSAFPEPHEYARQCCLIFIAKKTVSAWVYLYNWPIKNLQKIDTGNYLHFKTIKKS